MKEIVVAKMRMLIMIKNIVVWMLGLCIFFVESVASSSEGISEEEWIKSEITVTIQKTISLLRSLDTCDKYGEIGWGNSLTIGVAVGKLNKTLNNIKNINAEKIKEYSDKVKSYFNRYIVADLNSEGVGQYKVIVDKQNEIMIRAVYASESKKRY